MKKVYLVKKNSDSTLVGYVAFLGLCYFTYRESIFWQTFLTEDEQKSSLASACPHNTLEMSRHSYWNYKATRKTTYLTKVAYER